MQERTQSQFMALLRKVFPESVLEYLVPGAGGETLYAIAQLAERLSTAAKHLYDDLTAGTAGMGVKAQLTVTLTRTGTDAGTLYAGAELCDIHGERFVTLADAVYAAGDVADRDVSVESVYRSRQANLSAGTVLVIHRAVGATGDPVVVWDPTLTATAVGVDVTGRPPMLEQLASDRGISPQPSETAAQLRGRIRALPEQVTPAALLRAVETLATGAVIVEGPDLSFFTDYQGNTDGEWDPGADAPAYRLDSIGANWLVVRTDPLDTATAAALYALLARAVPACTRWTLEDYA